jgi:hypothetical protein
MYNDNFYSDLSKSLKAKDTNSANKVVMMELGDTIAKDKDKFIEVLRSSGIGVSDYAPDATLVELFIDNAPKNDKLLIGTAYLLAERNKTVGADGEENISDVGVKATYKVMNSYFDGGDEETSNWVGAIAGALGEGAKLGTKITEGQQRKKYGAQMQLEKKQEASNQLRQSIIGQRQQEATNKAEAQKQGQKTTQLILYIGGGVLLLSIGLGIYFMNKKK